MLDVFEEQKECLVCLRTEKMPLWARTEWIKGMRDKRQLGR